MSVCKSGRANDEVPLVLASGREPAVSP